MSTSTKNSGKKPKKCRSQELPEQAPARRLKVPSELDRKAFHLHSQGMSQRTIAARLGVAQPTVHRAIRRMVRWQGTTIAEDRGGLTGFQKFRVACRRHKIFLRHIQRLALREFHRSCERIPVEKKIRTWDETKDDGVKQHVRAEEYLKPQYGRDPYLGTAARGTGASSATSSSTPKSGTAGTARLGSGRGG